MEGLVKRVYLLAGILLATGIAFVMIPKNDKKSNKDENWMISQVPEVVGQYRYIPPSAGQPVSYKMDARTYEILKPYGIVCREYSFASNKYDVVVIASNSDDSFHDYRVCFSAQGWTLGELEEVPVESKSRGKFLVTMTKMSNRSTEKLAAFVYRSEKGFFTNTGQIKKAMLLDSLIHGEKFDAIFYRFIPQTSVTKEELVKFIGDYMDAANASSKGYF